MPLPKTGPKWMPTLTLYSGAFSFVSYTHSLNSCPYGQVFTYGEYLPWHALGAHFCGN